MPVQRFVFMRSQLIDDRLNAQHQELVAQMQPEFQILLTRSIVKDSVNERHNGRLKIHIIPVGSGGSIQIVDDALESSAFGGKSLEMQHC